VFGRNAETTRCVEVKAADCRSELLQGGHQERTSCLHVRLGVIDEAKVFWFSSSAGSWVVARGLRGCTTPKAMGVDLIVRIRRTGSRYSGEFKENKNFEEIPTCTQGEERKESESGRLRSHSQASTTGGHLRPKTPLTLQHMHSALQTSKTFANTNFLGSFTSFSTC
jgi:hypothetical protein